MKILQDASQVLSEPSLVAHNPIGALLLVFGMLAISVVILIFGSKWLLKLLEKKYPEKAMGMFFTGLMGLIALFSIVLLVIDFA